MKKIFHSELARFISAGAATLALDYFVLWALAECVRLHYILAAALSFTLAVLANYLLCLTWVFRKSRKQSARQLLFFALTSIAGLFLNIGIMKILVDFCGTHYLLAKAAATAAVTAWNYVTKKMAMEG